MSPVEALAVSIGAAAGAPLRYWTDRLATRLLPNHGAGTLTINTIGAFILGWIVTADLSANWFALLGTGFCGALTTFSALALHTYRLLRLRQRISAALFVSTGLGLGLIMVPLGQALAT